MTDSKLRIPVAMVLTLGAALWAMDKAAVPYPAEFRSWHLVKSVIVGPEHKSFPTRGGLHHIYANDRALEGYRTGRFADGSVIVEEIVQTKDGEGETKGMQLEGERRGINVMMKDEKRYAQTGGWGYESFKGDTRAGTLTAEVQSTCNACHGGQKEIDHVFSRVRP